MTSLQKSDKMTIINRKGEGEIPRYNIIQKILASPSEVLLRMFMNSKCSIKILLFKGILKVEHQPKGEDNAKYLSFFVFCSVVFFFILLFL